MSIFDFKDIVETTHDMVLVCDEDGLIVYANRAAQTWLKRDFHELQDHPVDTWLRGTDGLLWPSDGGPEDNLLFYEANGRHERHRGVVAALPVDGAQGWLVQLQCSHGGDSDKLEGLMALAGTIAGQLESQLRTIISASSEALLQKPRQTLAEHLRKVLEAAQAAARLQKQVEGLAGDTPDIQKGALSMSSLLIDSERAILAALGPDIALDLRADEGEGLIEGDPHALGIVLVELADWVRRHHPGDGVACFSVSEVGDRVRLAVSDDGPGLSVQQRMELHDRDEGPGLGLAIVFGVVEQHDGRVLVDSALGQGTTFHIDFPNMTSAPQKRAATPARGTETVLVVEDEEVINRWVTVTLESLGYKVFSATNGVEATTLLRERRHEIDLMLIDAVLPGVSGLEIISEVLHVDPNARVLLVTGYSADVMTNDILQRVPMLEKPFSPAELIDRVRGLLDS